VSGSGGLDRHSHTDIDQIERFRPGAVAGIGHRRTTLAALATTLKTPAARAAVTVAAALAVFAAWLIARDRSDIGVGFLFVVPVALASWWFGHRGAWLALLASIGLLVVGERIHHVHAFPAWLAVRTLILLAAGILVTELRRQRVLAWSSAGELVVIREALTPRALTELVGVEAGAAFLPSDRGVSGDFYLLANGPDGATVAIVGDVAGHGLPAARLATFVRASLASYAAYSSDPSEILSLANRAVLDRDGSRVNMVTAVCVSVDRERRVRWAVAGHPPPLRLPSLEELPVQGRHLPLGVYPDLVLEASVDVLAEGEGVLVYTDGATEARRRGAMLGLDGLRALAAPLVEHSAREIASGLERALLDHVDDALTDDVCVLVMRPTG
jgi:hypothetical protein